MCEREDVGLDWKPLLGDRSFYPPEDDRLYVSGVDDIYGGDCFDDYAKWFWEEYGFEIYDDIEM